MIVAPNTVIAPELIEIGTIIWAPSLPTGRLMVEGITESGTSFRFTDAVGNHTNIACDAQVKVLGYFNP